MSRMLILGAAGAAAVDPSGQVLAVEQRRESFLLRLRNDRDAREPEASNALAQIPIVRVTTMVSAIL
jgi:hypothetical protein